MGQYAPITISLRPTRGIVHQTRSTQIRISRYKPQIRILKSDRTFRQKRVKNNNHSPRKWMFNGSRERRKMYGHLYGIRTSERTYHGHS